MPLKLKWFILKKIIYGTLTMDPMPLKALSSAAVPIFVVTEFFLCSSVFNSWDFVILTPLSSPLTAYQLTARVLPILYCVELKRLHLKLLHPPSPSQTVDPCTLILWATFTPCLCMMNDTSNMASTGYSCIVRYVFYIEFYMYFKVPNLI